MPIYEYKCTSCGEKFELRRSMNDTSEIRCPKCGDEKPKRVFSVFAMNSSGSAHTSCTSPT